MLGNKILKRGLFGFPIGVTISMLIVFFASLIIGEKSGETLYVLHPDAISKYGSELNAFAVIIFTSGFLGVLYSSTSAFFEIDKWSLTKATIIHFILTTSVLLFVAHLNYWLERSLVGVLSYLIISAVIYLGIWTGMYFFWKSKIKNLNDKMNKK